MVGFKLYAVLNLPDGHPGAFIQGVTVGSPILGHLAKQLEISNNSAAVKRRRLLGQVEFIGG